MNRVISFVTLLTLASCAAVPYKPYAREVKKKPGIEGVISLKPNFVPEDRAVADSLMAKNCGVNPVTVLEEGEVAVGTTTSSNSKATAEKENKSFNLGGMKFLTNTPTDVKNTESSSQTVAVKEWQISYNCKTVETKTVQATKSSRSSKSSKAAQAAAAQAVIRK